MGSPSITLRLYDGPTCPRCRAKLTADWIRTGVVTCPDCNRDFEATAFTPPVRRLHVAQVAAAGPVEANACANHARNAAVTNCRRCGLLICALCDMNVGSGSYCPSCYERARNEGSDPAVVTKRRDYSSMAGVTVVAGFFFFIVGALFGVLALVYQARARKQRAERGEPRWSVGMVVVLVLALGEIVGGIAIDATMIAALTGVLK
jgi:ribosomal protein L37AE/L43A